MANIVYSKEDVKDRHAGKHIIGFLDGHVELTNGYGDLPDTYSPGGVVTVFSSGFDATGALLASGATDPHWTVTPPGGSAGPAVVSNEVWPVGNPWAANTPSSKWIGPEANPATGLNGDYTYTTTFDVPSARVGNLTLTIKPLSPNSNGPTAAFM